MAASPQKAGRLTNAEIIVTTLDSLLDHEASLVVYGRAAIALGFANPPSAVGLSLGVDVILRHSQNAVLDADDQFWEAQAKLNELLEKQGLYMTHLFGEEQVFLRPDWEQHLVPVLRPPTRWLKLLRPHTIDLILTKMMRGNDEQDMADVRFLIQHDGLTAAQMEPAFATVRMPDCIELHEAFARALPAVRAML